MAQFRIEAIADGAKKPRSLTVEAPDKHAAMQEVSSKGFRVVAIGEQAPPEAPAPDRQPPARLADLAPADASRLIMWAVFRGALLAWLAISVFGGIVWVMWLATRE